MQNLFVFAEVKMAATAPCIKEPNVLKQYCNPLNICQIATSKKNLRPVLASVIKEVPISQKGQRI
jgi:hypothetical protein